MVVSPLMEDLPTPLQIWAIDKLRLRLRDYMEDLPAGGGHKRRVVSTGGEFLYTEELTAATSAGFRNVRIEKVAAQIVRSRDHS